MVASVVPKTAITATLPPIMARIAECESGGNPKAKNPRSSASGKFQFIDSTWKHYGQKLWGDNWVKKDKFNEAHNTELALYAYKLNGTADWEASKPCWNPQYAQKIWVLALEVSI